MTNYLRVDAVNRQLVMDKTFAKNAQIVGSAEYDMLQRARSDYATYSVVTRQIKRNLNKESYRGLTYQYMEEMRLISQCHSKAFRYPTIKKWFLERYPEVRNFGVRNAEYTGELALSQKNKEVA